MLTTFLLEIVTPQRVAYSNQVEMITAPSAAGIIGILPHHVPLFTRLVEGELKIIKDKEEMFLAIGGGFMEVTPQKTTVLVTEALHSHEINEKEVIDAQKRAQDALKSQPKGAELIEAQNLFRRSTIALKVFHKRRRASLH